MFLWVTTTCAWMLEDSVEPPEAGVTGSCEPLGAELRFLSPWCSACSHWFSVLFQRTLSYWRGGFGMAGGVVYGTALGVLVWHAQCAWKDRKESCSANMASSIAGSCYATGRRLDTTPPPHFHHFISLVENHLAAVKDFGSLGTCNHFIFADNLIKKMYLQSYLKEAKKN